MEVRPVDFNGPTGATMPIPMDVKPTADELLDAAHDQGARPARARSSGIPNGAVFEEPSSVVQPEDGGVGGAPGPRQRADDARPRGDDARGPAATSPRGRTTRYPFRLVGRRMNSRYNSGGMTAPRLQSKEPTNPAFMHPDDLRHAGPAQRRRGRDQLGARHDPRRRGGRRHHPARPRRDEPRVGRRRGARRRRCATSAATRRASSTSPTSGTRTAASR